MNLKLNSPLWNKKFREAKDFSIKEEILNPTPKIKTSPQSCQKDFCKVWNILTNYEI